MSEPKCYCENCQVGLPCLLASQSPESAPRPMSNVCICGVSGPFKGHSFTCPAHVAPESAPIPSEGTPDCGFCYDESECRAAGSCSRGYLPLPASFRPEAGRGEPEGGGDDIYQFGQTALSRPAPSLPEGDDGEDDLTEQHLRTLVAAAKDGTPDMRVRALGGAIERLRRMSERHRAAAARLTKLEGERNRLRAENEWLATPIVLKALGGSVDVTVPAAKAVDALARVAHQEQARADESQSHAARAGEALEKLTSRADYFAAACSVGAAACTEAAFRAHPIYKQGAASALRALRDALASLRPLVPPQSTTPKTPER